MEYITFALGKGRLAKKTLELFEQIGITCEEMKDKDSRKLIFVNEDLKLKFFFFCNILKYSSAFKFNSCNSFGNFSLFATYVPNTPNFTLINNSLT